MKYFGLLVCTALATAIAPARAAEECLSVQNDLDRLACYDRLHGRTPKTEPIASKGRWVVTQETSKMTDETNVFMVVMSDEIIQCGRLTDERITLVVRCLEGKTSLVFQTACHMTSSEYNNYGSVEYRLDSEPTKKLSADASTDSSSLGLWTGPKSIPVIKQMFGKSKMLVRMMPYGQNKFTATFDISALENSITPLRKACKW